MAKVYDIAFMFNYPHPSGDKRRDIFFSRRDAHRVPELPPEAIARYQALGYLTVAEVPDEEFQRQQAATLEVAVPLFGTDSPAPRIGPGAMPYPLGQSEGSKRLVNRMKAAFEGNEAQTRLLEELAEAETSGAPAPTAAEIDAENVGTSTRPKARGR